jgi:hypothetical protein
MSLKSTATQIQDPDDNRGTGRDFAPIPNYKQSSVSNASWVNVTLTKTDSDGSTTQVFFLAKK